jgi:hypothetical protein
MRALLVFKFHLAVDYGRGVCLIAAENFKDAQQLIEERTPEDRWYSWSGEDQPVDGFVFHTETNDKAIEILECSYIE